jgi:tRNA(Ile)-lysidine synthase
MMDVNVFRTPAMRAEADLAENGIILGKVRGILAALSGGADSVFLLGVLKVLSEAHGFDLRALHVEHGIREEESLSDASFSKRLAEELSVPIRIVSVDVPGEAERRGKGLEEMARELRYAALREMLREMPDGSYIAIGHHATDQAETVLFHLLRGCGGAGAGGMRVASGDILRPLLGFCADEIRDLLDQSGIPYRIDSSNCDESFDRNLLRQTVFPALARIRPNPAEAIAASAAHIREESDALDAIAMQFYRENPAPLRREALAALPKPVFARVLQRLAGDAGCEMPEAVHIDAAFAQIKQKGIFSLSFPGGKTLRILRETVTFSEALQYSEEEVRPGIMRLSGRNSVFALFSAEDEKEIEDFRIVYKKSKKALICSDKIKGTLTLRQARPGDSYRYGGMTHSVRKLFASRRLDDITREKLPILCDALGILWIPGFGVREDADGKDAAPSRQLCFFYAEEAEKQSES